MHVADAFQSIEITAGARPGLLLVGGDAGYGDGVTVECARDFHFRARELLWRLLITQLIDLPAGADQNILRAALYALQGAILVAFARHHVFGPAHGVTDGPHKSLSGLSRRRQGEARDQQQ